MYIFSPRQRNLRQGAQRINTLNRQIEQETGKLREDEPTNIAAIEEMRKVCLDLHSFEHG